MPPSRLMIRSAIGVSVAAAVLLAGGFVYGLYAAFGGTVGSSSVSSPSQASVSPKPLTQSGKNVHILALGDSLAHGLGDASGNGFVGDVSQHYRQQGYNVVQSNLGIDGLTSSGLVQEMKQPAVQTLLPSANLILISIGGNDLSQAAGLPAIHNARIASAESQFKSNITQILTQIRSVNPSAPILLVGLYNPYGNIAQTKVQTDNIVQSWDLMEDTIAAKYPKTVVVQTFDLFELHGGQFLYVDNFHPNQQGYQRVADRIWQDLQTS